MKLYLYLVLLLALYYVYVLLRFAIKRIILLHKIKRFAKENSIEYKITTPAFLIPSNRYGTAVLLKTEKGTYNIRLFGLLRKKLRGTFLEQGNVLDGEIHPQDGSV